MVTQDTPITMAESAKVEQRRLEIFASQQYHWKSLSHTDQMKMARELLQFRAFLRSLKKE
jgi:hypothetical protein